MFLEHSTGDVRDSPEGVSRDESDRPRDLPRALMSYAKCRQAGYRIQVDQTSRTVELTKSKRTSLKLCTRPRLLHRPGADGGDRDQSLNNSKAELLELQSALPEMSG